MEEFCIEEKRKPFSTTIDFDLQRKFKVRCVENDLKLNETLETLMKMFIEKDKNPNIKIILDDLLLNKTK